MVALQDAALVINSFDAMMADPHPTEGWQAYAAIVGSDGAVFGDPEMVISTIASQLSDGDLESVDRAGNKEAKFLIVFEAPEADDPGAALALGQAALERALRFKGWAPLSWTSPLSGAEASVTEMTSAWVTKDFNDLDEMLQGQRIVSVTVHARPFVRATDAVTIDAPSVVGSTTTTVDSGSSATGWSIQTTAPAPAVNAETNPEFKTNVTGYAVGSGTASLNWLSNAGHTTAEAHTPTTANGESYVNGPLHTVTAGSVVLIGSVTSTAILSPVFATNIVRVRFYSDTAGASQIGGDTVLTASGGDWVTRTWSVTAPVGAVRMRVYRGIKQPSNGSAGLWYIDKQWTIVTPVGSVAPSTAYWDGDTTDTAAVNYSWTGTANASTSTATWTAPSLAVVSGAVRGTAYGRASVSIRRTGAVSMTSLPYMRITGVASAFSDGQVTVSDSGSAVTPTSYSYNPATGAFEVLVKRASGFSAVDVTFSRTGGSVSTTAGIFVAVDNIEITDTPVGGRAQTRQVTIYGSQRTELSLAVLGLDAAGTAPVALGEQVLVHTATAGDDSRSKFLGCRAASGVAGPTSDVTAITGSYNTLSTTVSPTTFPFSAATLLPGQYVAYTRLQGTAAATRTLSYAASLDGAGALDASDPATGWYTSQVAVTTAWRIAPLGYLMLPPANIEDPAATLTVKIAADVASVVRVDEIWLAHVESGQVTLLDTNDSGISAVRLDAATVEASEPSAWVGVATATGTGTMMAAGTRILAFDQHMAEPGLLQISTVTPGCATSRVSASYFPRYAHDVAPLPAS